MSENLPGNEPNTTPPQAQPVPPVAPAAPYQGYAQTPAVAPKGLAISGMILGIVGLLASAVLFFVPGLGPVLGLVGVILSIVALVKKQPKGLAITGIITGALAIIVGIILTMVMFAVAAQVINDPQFQDQLQQLEQEIEQQ